MSTLAAHARPTKARSAPVGQRIEYSAFPTELGWIAILGRENALCGLTLGHRSPADAIAELLSRNADLLQDANSPSPREGDWNADLRRQIIRYAQGEPVDFFSASLAPFSGTPLRVRILQETCRIPYGKTITYSDLAKASGAPGAARAVGNVMASNRIPLVVPCHRVVAVGALGGYSAPQGVELKKRLLSMESAQCHAH